ncbi:acyl-CoA carboxylase epsilon subunit [Streptomyces sp. NPDC058701]|uniref:acyl-CoA carboxylase epsilon subunit n=1 Tax=Streptomyces sp. NPDC058701 TaxID=3346608 RepID=UPI0036461C3C
MSNDAATAPIAQVAPSAPIASLIRVERGLAAPEELAAIAVVVACYARRTGRVRGAAEPKGGGPGRGGRRPARANAGCWAGCWACR